MFVRKPKLLSLTPTTLLERNLNEFRRRLGMLTREQELQIENLLISTVTRVSLVAARVMAERLKGEAK
jgi:hypothetical protein